MKRVVLIDTSYPINTRNIRILQSLENDEKHIITWNRDGRPVKANNMWVEHIFFCKSPYGHAVQKFILLFYFAGFVKKQIANIKPDFIIASHWETLLIAVFFKNRNSRVVYENLDIPTSGNSVVRRILQTVEKTALKKTECMIVASRFYKDLYPRYKKQITILENKPFRSIMTDKPACFSHSSNNLKISFIGNLRYFRCMQNLIIASDGLPIDILFFGEGPDYANLVNFACAYRNVYFFGKYNYDDIRCIYELSDLIWAVYPNRDYNVKYAISNKFFESLVFEKPSVFAENTALGDFVSQNNIGFTVDPYSIVDIKNSFLNILNDKDILVKIILEIKKYNSLNSLFWDDDKHQLQKIFIGGGNDTRTIF